MNDSIIWLSFLVTLSVSIIVSIVVTRMSLKSICQKEIKKIHYRPYSNGSYFKMKVEKRKLKGNKLECSGPFEGELPAFNNILHINIGAKDYAVLVRRKHKDGDRAYLKLFLPEKIDPEFVTTVTSLRKSYLNIVDELTDTVNYPVVIKKPLNQYLLAGFVIMMGVVMLIISTYGDTAAIGLGLAFVFLAAGIFLVLDTALSKATFLDEDNIEIRTITKTYKLKAKEIRYQIVYTQTEHFQFMIYLKEGNKQLCIFEDLSKNFRTALSALQILTRNSDQEKQ